MADTCALGAGAEGGVTTFRAGAPCPLGRLHCRPAPPSPPREYLSWQLAGSGEGKKGGAPADVAHTDAIAKGSAKEVVPVARTGGPPEETRHFSSERSRAASPGSAGDPVAVRGAEERPQPPAIMPRASPLPEGTASEPRDSVLHGVGPAPGPEELLGDPQAAMVSVTGASNWKESFSCVWHVEGTCVRSIQTTEILTKCSRPSEATSSLSLLQTPTALSYPHTPYNLAVPTIATGTPPRPSPPSEPPAKASRSADSHQVPTGILSSMALT